MRRSKLPRPNDGKAHFMIVDELEPISHAVRRDDDAVHRCRSMIRAEGQCRGVPVQRKSSAVAGVRRRVILEPLRGRVHCFFARLGLIDGASPALSLDRAINRGVTAAVYTEAMFTTATSSTMGRSASRSSRPRRIEPGSPFAPSA